MKYPSVKIDPERVLKEIMVDLKHKPVPENPLNEMKLKCMLEKIQEPVPFWDRPSEQAYEDKK